MRFVQTLCATCQRTLHALQWFQQMCAAKCQTFIKLPDAPRADAKTTVRSQEARQQIIPRVNARGEVRGNATRLHILFQSRHANNEKLHCGSIPVSKGAVRYENVKVHE